MVPSHCNGSSLGSMTQTRCRVGDERESNRDETKTTVSRKEKAMKRVGRENLIDFFRTSDRTRTRWRKRMDRRSPKKDSEKLAEGERREIRPFFFPFFSFPVAFGGDFGVSYLCCHGNSLDSRAERTNNSGRGKTEGKRAKERKKLEKSSLYYIYASLCSRFPSFVSAITDKHAAKAQTYVMKYDSASSFRSVGSWGNFADTYMTRHECGASLTQSLVHDQQLVS